MKKKARLDKGTNVLTLNKAFKIVIEDIEHSSYKPKQIKVEA